MALDGIILHKLTNEIKNSLPIKINKIYQVSNTEILFHVRCNRNKNNLIISTHSIYNRIHFSNHKYPTPESPSNFITLLRKHLENGTIFHVEQRGLDRILKLEITHRSEIGDREIKTLYIELMGKYANIILVNQDGIIIDALKRIPPFENNKRTIMPTAHYPIIDLQAKKNPFTTTSFDIETPFLDQFEGFSPLLSKEFHYRISQGESFYDIVKQLETSNTIYICKYKNNFEYHFIPLTHIASEFKTYPIHEAMDYIYFSLEEKDRIKQLTGDIFKFIKRQLKHYEGKLPKLYDALDESLNNEIYRTYGELLYCNLDKTEKGLKHIEVFDFENKLITIPLDEKYDLKTNAAKYFTKYTKGKKAIDHLNHQIHLAQKELDYFKALEYQLQQASFQDAYEIKEELIKYGYLKPSVAKIRKKSKKMEHIPNYTELIYKGTIIAFGKNNIQNDYLTFKYAHKEDMWFHAKDYHGTHVICKAKQLDEDLIRTCAKLAAYYSGGKLSSSIPVNYTLIKHLKKIPGGKLGQVIMNQYQTIYIDVEESEIEKIVGK